MRKGRRVIMSTTPAGTVSETNFTGRVGPRVATNIPRIIFSEKNNYYKRRPGGRCDTAAVDINAIKQPSAAGGTVVIWENVVCGGGKRNGIKEGRKSKFIILLYSNFRAVQNRILKYKINEEEEEKNAAGAK